MPGVPILSEAASVAAANGIGKTKIGEEAR
jgi:hypothetical protein